MREVTVTVPAKINLSLRVGAARPDGYHRLVTVYQAIGMYDEVRARAAPAGSFSVTVDGDERIAVSEVPTDDTNLALRAARLLAQRLDLAAGVQLEVTKGIPVAGGMAGGSADAAGALVACNALWGTQVSRPELSALAAELGSDVPFLLVGGTAVGTGRGEVVTPAMVRGEYWWVVLESTQGLSTPEVYREFDRLTTSGDLVTPDVPDAVMAALRSGIVERLGAALSNDLQPAALRLRPELAKVLECGVQSSAHGAIVSGSGPSCLFLTEDRAHAMRVARALTASGFGPVSFAAGPVPGAKVVGGDG